MGGRATTITSTLNNDAIRFESAGQFIGTPGWIHEKRILESFELIFVTQGMLPLRVGNQDLHIGVGDVVLIPPKCEHEGSSYITNTLEFFWAHFRLRSWHYSTAAETAPKKGESTAQPDAITISLPTFGTQLNTDRLTIMFDQLLDIYQMTYPKPSLYCDCFTTCLLCEIESLTRQATTASAPQQERHVLWKIYEWIRINAFENISVNRIAEQFHYSPSYLSTIYKQHFGISISTQISKIRIERAQEMLLQTSMSVQQVAAASGYNDPKYFMRVFKQHTGLTPTNYRTSFTMRHLNNQ